MWGADTLGGKGGLRTGGVGNVLFSLCYLVGSSESPLLPDTGLLLPAKVLM